jgi:hypothetical protein
MLFLLLIKLVIMKRQMLIVFLLFASISMIAQEPGIDNMPSKTETGPMKKEYYWFNPHASVTIPNPTANRAFRKNLAGVYKVSTGIDILLFKGIFAGALYENATLKITGITGASYFHYQPVMKINNAGVRVGGRGYFGERNRMIYSLSLAIGESWTHYKDMRCKDSTVAPALIRYACPFVQPELGVYFLVESNFAIGATISYCAYNKKFDPYEICLDSWKAVGAMGNGNIQYLSFGFGFYYSFLRKKSRV